MSAIQGYPGFMSHHPLGKNKQANGGGFLDGALALIEHSNCSVKNKQ
jgi:hypothetical protein